jgi:hypothetical protein
MNGAQEAQDQIEHHLDGSPGKPDQIGEAGVGVVHPNAEQCVQRGSGADDEERQSEREGDGCDDEDQQHVQQLTPGLRMKQPAELLA